MFDYVQFATFISQFTHVDTIICVDKWLNHYKTISAILITEWKYINNYLFQL